MDLLALLGTNGRNQIQTGNIGKTMSDNNGHNPAVLVFALVMVISLPLMAGAQTKRAMAIDDLITSESSWPSGARGGLALNPTAGTWTFMNCRVETSARCSNHQTSPWRIFVSRRTAARSGSQRARRPHTISISCPFPAERRSGLPQAERFLRLPRGPISLSFRSRHSRLQPSFSASRPMVAA